MNRNARSTFFFSDGFAGAHRSIKPMQFEATGSFFDDLATACKDQWDAAWSRTHYLVDLPRLVPAIRTMVSGLSQQPEEANSRFLNSWPGWLTWHRRVTRMISIEGTHVIHSNNR